MSFTTQKHSLNNTSYVAYSLSKIVHQSNTVLAYSLKLKCWTCQKLLINRSAIVSLTFLLQIQLQVMWHLVCQKNQKINQMQLQVMLSVYS